MKAVRFIFSDGNTVMCYLSNPNDKEYGVVFFGSQNGDFPKIIPTNNFEKSMNEFIELNKNHEKLENIEVF